MILYVQQQLEALHLRIFQAIQTHIQHIKSILFCVQSYEAWKNNLVFWFCQEGHNIIQKLESYRGFLQFYQFWSILENLNFSILFAKIKILPGSIMKVILDYESRSWSLAVFFETNSHNNL